MIHSTPPHVLLVGDFVKHTGFARVNAAIAQGLAALGWRVSVLGVGYAGDPTPLQQQFRLYPAGANGSDHYGMARLPHMLAHAQPDVVLLVNDPWVVDDYLAFLASVPGLSLPPIVAYLPVDGPCLNPARLQHLRRLTTPVAYTQFGADELTRARVPGPIPVIPHGIDLRQFQPGDRAAARAMLKMPGNGFMVLLCDTNSSRKRLDLAIRAFAEFAVGAPGAQLLIHSELDSPWGWDLAFLCHQAGVLERTIFTGKGGKLTDGALTTVYMAADVRLTATMGEGWGFTVMEAMACGLPVIAPRWAALAEWAEDTALLVDCDPALTFTYVASGNQQGGVVCPSDLASALSILYRDPAVYGFWRARGLARVAEPQYRWAAIAQQWDEVLRAATGERATYAREREAAHASA